VEITATELKNNLGMYIKAARAEDVVITKNGKPLVRLSAYSPEASETLESAEDIGTSAADSLYDFSVPEPSFLRECPLPTSIGAGGTGEWLITHNGEPVANIVPVKKKRRLGFIRTGGSMADEEAAALMEPVMSEEELGEWLNGPL
jgi:prevent-host-death family protein